MDNLGSHKGPGVRAAIEAAGGAFTPEECTNYFAAAGYDTDAA